MRLRSALAVCLLAAGPVAAEDITARALLSYQNLNTGFFTTSGFRQTYDLRLERAIANPATFRIFFRGEDFRGSTETGSSPLRAGFRQLQPGGEFFYQLPKVQAQLTHNTLQARSENGSFANTRTLERSAGRFAWRPDALPGVTLEAQRNRSKDQSTGLNTTDELALAGIDYEYRKLRVAATERLSRLSDSQFGFGRKTVDHLAQATYDDRFFGGKVSTFANGTATLSRLTERAGTGTVRIPNPVSIGRAFYTIDDTPLDDRDRPFNPLPALIDNDLSASTGVSLGPDSAMYQNLGFDFERFADVDEIQVVVRDAAGNPVKLGGSVRFDAFVSDDGIVWTPLKGGARTVFDIARSFYDVTFQLTSTRWLKLVTFNANAEATFVTEVQAFYHTQLVANQRRTTDIRLYSGVGTITAQPAKWVLLSYNGLFNAVTQRPSDRDPFSTNDMDHVGAVQVDPVRYLSLLARYQTRAVAQTGGLRQTLHGWTTILRVLPTTALNIALEMDRHNEDNQGRLSQTNTVVLHNFARILPSFDVNIDVGRQRQDFITEERIADQKFVTGVGNVQLFRSLRLLLTTSIQRTTFTGSGAILEGLPPARDDRSAVEFYYRPGQPFALGARFGRVSSDTISGTTQRYRVEWYPFSRGTVSIGGTYDQDVDPYSKRKSSRLLFTPRWTMNRHAIFDLNYTAVSSSGDQYSRTRAFYATLTLTK